MFHHDEVIHEIQRSEPPAGLVGSERCRSAPKDMAVLVRYGTVSIRLPGDRHQAKLDEADRDRRGCALLSEVT